MYDVDASVVGSSSWWQKSWCVTCGGPTTGSATFERRETERERASSLGWPRGTHERSQRERERARGRDLIGQKLNGPRGGVRMEEKRKKKKRQKREKKKKEKEENVCTRAQF